MGLTALRLAALPLPDRIGYAAAPFAASIALALAAAATLRAALWLRGRWPALAGSLIIGAAVTGTNYAGLAALRAYPGVRLVAERDEINYDAGLVARVQRRNAETAPLRPWPIAANNGAATNGAGHNGASVKGLPLDQLRAGQGLFAAAERR